MAKKTHGRTASGVPITDELVSKLAKKAEAGYDVEQTLRRRGGRPLIGSAAASVESVRLEPELRQALANRAKRDHETTSAVIRKALRNYLKLAWDPYRASAACTVATAAAPAMSIGSVLRVARLSRKAPSSAPIRPIASSRAVG